MAINLFQYTKSNLESQIVRQRWERQDGFYIKEMTGSTWGIAGYGRIGKETARLAQAIGCKVLAGEQNTL